MEAAKMKENFETDIIRNGVRDMFFVAMIEVQRIEKKLLINHRRE